MHPAKPSAVRGGQTGDNKKKDRLYIKSGEIHWLNMPAGNGAKLHPGLHELQFYILLPFRQLYATKPDLPSPIWNGKDLGIKMDEEGWYLDVCEDGVSEGRS